MDGFLAFLGIVVACIGIICLLSKGADIVKTLSTDCDEEDVKYD